MTWKERLQSLWWLWFAIVIGVIVIGAIVRWSLWEALPGYQALAAVNRLEEGLANLRSDVSELRTDVGKKLSSDELAKLQPTAEPTPELEKKPESKSTPTTEPAAEAEAQIAKASREGCPDPEQIGPWAPSASWEGETFEVTASRGPVHLGLWWPGGGTPWGTDEVSLLLEPGQSIEVINGAGRGWDYAEECTESEVIRQRNKYLENRPEDTNFHGAVDLKTLLELELVRMRR